MRLILLVLKIKYLILAKKLDNNTKISETENKTTDHDHDKSITIQEFNRFTSES